MRSARENKAGQSTKGSVVMEKKRENWGGGGVVVGGGGNFPRKKQLKKVEGQLRIEKKNLIIGTESSSRPFRGDSRPARQEGVRGNDGRKSACQEFSGKSAIISPILQKRGGRTMSKKKC